MTEYLTIEEIHSLPEGTVVGAMAASDWTDDDDPDITIVTGETHSLIKHGHKWILADHQNNTTDQSAHNTGYWSHVWLLESAPAAVTWGTVDKATNVI